MGLKVYTKSGVEFFTIKAFEFSSEHMGEKKITAKVYSPDKIDFTVDSYVMFRGTKYSIFEDVSGTKTARTSEGIGNAMQYDLVFYAPHKKLTTVNFEDYVSKDDTNQYYTGTPIFSFYNNVNELAIRLQANLDRFFGADVWTVIVDDSVVLEEKEVAVSNIKVWDGLMLANSIFGLNFYIDGNTIKIGGTGDQIPGTFYYGKGRGLYEIKRVFESTENIITRLKVYGGSRNLPYDYLRDEDAKGRYFTQLMLPNFATTGIDYVDAPQDMIDKYGIREGSVVFDDIYPSIEEVDLGEGRIDEIVSVGTIDPESDYFTVQVRDLGFEITDHLTAETPRLSIKGSNADGSATYLGGYEFEIMENGTSGNTIRMLKNQADGKVLPDDVTTVRAGDRFVLLGIKMPQSYITNAENKLPTRATEYMASDIGVELSYPVKLDEKYVEINGIGDSFDAGKQAKIEDDDLEVANYFTIQNIAIKFDDILPVYDMKLSNIKKNTLKEEFKRTETKQGIKNTSITNNNNFTTTNNNTTVNKIQKSITWQ